ncbi:MAG: ABC transporter substrate-binding protein [Polaromonas sp.]|nr:ABC transporter substrate-binding protein [Polaromonas sp.]
MKNRKITPRRQPPLTTLLLTAALAAAPALAQEKISNGVVKIGVMNDLTGLYSDLGGKSSIDAARMAIEDFGGKVAGKPIELVFADHQNKADIASSRAREWFDKDHVDVIVDLVNSSAALAVAKLARDSKKLVLVSGGGATRLTNEDCSPNTIHWTYDTYSLANGTARAMVKQGLDSWYFITADYAFGHSLEKDAGDVVKEAGGKLVGSVRHPFPGTDFSSFLLQAQASGAKVVGLANAGPDMNNTIKQANEFGVVPKQSLAALLVFIDEIHSMGLKNTQGMYLTTGFYWDMNDQTRTFARRFFERNKRMPNMVHAGIHSAVTHYLKAIQAAGTDDSAAVIAKMKATPVNDFFAKNGRIRDDGRMMHDMYLMQVKKPSESKYPWDYYSVRQVIPAEQAFLPVAKSVCPLLKKK